MPSTRQPSPVNAHHHPFFSCLSFLTSALIGTLVAFATVSLLPASNLSLLRSPASAPPSPLSAPISVPTPIPPPAPIITRRRYSRAKKAIPSCAYPSNNPSSSSTVPAKSFLMVFMSRSGSTAISQAMVQHPQIKHGFELLESSGIPYDSPNDALNATRNFFRSGLADGLIPGFKVRASYILAYPAGWRRLVREFNTRIIWQYRKNMFKVAVGEYARIVHGDYHKAAGILITDVVNQTKPDDPGETNSKSRCEFGVGCKFRIDDWEAFHDILTARIEHDTDMTRAVAVLNDGRDCVFELPYEDFLYARNNTMDDVWRFIGVPKVDTETWLVKATGDNLCEEIENYDQLCSNFYACPHWQPFLEDFDNNCRCRRFSTGTMRFCSIYSDKTQEQLPGRLQDEKRERDSIGSEDT